MELYDLIVIGAGPAGMTAGIYAGRARLKTLVLDKMGYGGQMLLIDRIENFPGFNEPINGFDLAEKMYKQMMGFGVEHKTGEVADIKCSGSFFEITASDNKYNAKSVILSMGAQPKKLNVKGEIEYIGKGVSYCAVCDGHFYKGKRVAVIGGGNTALADAEYLARLASEVTVIHRRDEFRADKILVERIKTNANVKFELSSVVESIEGGAVVEKLKIKNVRSSALKDMPVDGVFIFVGQQPQTEFLRAALELDEKGFIKRNNYLMTSLQGVFACGDCARTSFWQLITACSEGAQAVQFASEYLAEKKY